MQTLNRDATVADGACGTLYPPAARRQRRRQPPPRRRHAL